MVSSKNRMSDTIPRYLAKSGPTDDSLRQKGHLAREFVSELNMNESEQWPHITRHIPGEDAVADDAGGWSPPALKLLPSRNKEESAFGSFCLFVLMILLQLALGQAIRPAVALHTNKQLQGHRTYFFPVGGSRIGCDFR